MQTPIVLQVLMETHVTLIGKAELGKSVGGIFFREAGYHMTKQVLLFNAMQHSLEWPLQITPGEFCLVPEINLFRAPTFMVLFC